MLKHLTLSGLIFPLLTTTVLAQTSSKPSQCFGSTSNGRIAHAVQLPTSGKNYKSYSNLAATLGRTYVHTGVRDIVVGAYQNLARTHPSKVFKYAETGNKNGGLFSPHKTHQNGLSVDFMVPVTNAKGQSIHLPTHALNRYGYDIEFNKQGRYGKLKIDYEAMAAHIVALHQSAKKRGYDLWRVIFDPKLQTPLFQTSYKDYLKDNIQFTQRRSWVRHDEHYHVDFDIPCKTLN
ncbi:penicillin-insensitive murein endopeptidase [Kangiella shandongensis]|uniref:penicillin-insensitive murein endopeptidase n=1 Tax=Kangiella shandongensis TaxID=2763258 RepID=UPI001CC02DCC|nr:penicillin-insensitive murein endopeptidase [Kangiella shandongensis]